MELENPFKYIEPKYFGSPYINYNIDRATGIIAYNSLVLQKQKLIVHYPIQNSPVLLYIIASLSFDRQIGNKVLVLSNNHESLKKNYELVTLNRSSPLYALKPHGKLIRKRSNVWEKKPIYSKIKEEIFVLFYSHDYFKYEDHLDNIRYIIIDGYDGLLNNPSIQYFIEKTKDIPILFFTTNILYEPSYFMNKLKINPHIWCYTLLDIINELPLISQNESLPVLRIKKGKIVNDLVKESNLRIKLGENLIAIVSNPTDRISNLLYNNWIIYYQLKQIKNIETIQFSNLIRDLLQITQGTLFEFNAEGYRYGKPRTIRDSIDKIENLLVEFTTLDGPIYESMKQIYKIRNYFESKNTTPKYNLIVNILKSFCSTNSKILIVVKNEYNNDLLEVQLYNSIGLNNYECQIKIIPFYGLPMITERYDLCIFTTPLLERYYSFYISYLWNRALILTYWNETKLFYNTFKKISNRLITLHNDRVKILNKFNINKKNLIDGYNILYGNATNIETKILKRSITNIDDHTNITLNSTNLIWYENKSEIKANKFGLQISKLANNKEEIEDKLNKLGWSDNNIAKNKPEIEDFIKNQLIKIIDPNIQVDLIESIDTFDLETIKNVLQFNNENIENKDILPLSLLYLNNKTILVKNKSSKITIIQNNKVKEISISKLSIGDNIITVETSDTSLMGFVFSSSYYSEDEGIKIIQLGNLWRNEAEKFMETYNITFDQFAEMVKMNNARVSKLTIKSWFVDPSTPFVPKYLEDIIAIAETIGSVNLKLKAREIKKIGDLSRGKASKLGKQLSEIIKRYTTGELSIEAIQDIADKYGMDLTNLLSRSTINKIIMIEHNVELASNLINQTINSNDLI